MLPHQDPDKLIMQALHDGQIGVAYPINSFMSKFFNEFSNMNEDWYWFNAEIDKETYIPVPVSQLVIYSKEN